MCSSDLAAQTDPTPPRPFVVPAFTAYAHPDPHAVSRARDGGVRAWSGELHWHVQCDTPGKLQVHLLPLPKQKACSLELAVADVKVPIAFAGDAFDASCEVTQPGHVEISLRCASGTGPGLATLEFSGPAARGMRASTVERRNCASVHLGYEVPKETEGQVAWFYCEATPRTDPLWTYYMATG